MRNRRRPKSRRAVRFVDEFVQSQQGRNARFSWIAAENHRNGRVDFLCVDAHLPNLLGNHRNHRNHRSHRNHKNHRSCRDLQPIGACESIDVFVNPKVDCRNSTEFLDECNSEFYSFRQRVVEHYLQIPAGEESDVLKEFKNLIRSQDLEIKQLKIQLSAGGNVEPNCKNEK